MKLNDLYGIISDGWKYTILLKIKDTATGRCYTSDFCRGLRKGSENQEYVRFFKNLDLNVVEQLERGQKLLQDIEEYERRLQYAKQGEIFVRFDGSEVSLDEDIFNEIIIAQLKKDLNFLKERFENL